MTRLMMLTTALTLVAGCADSYPEAPRRCEMVLDAETNAWQRERGTCELPRSSDGPKVPAINAPKPDAPKPDAPKPDAPKPDKPKDNNGHGNGDEGDCSGKGCSDGDNPGKGGK